MKYIVGERIKFLQHNNSNAYKTEEGIIVKRNFKLFGCSNYYVELDNKEIIPVIEKDIIRSWLPMPKCKPPKDDSIMELYNWLKGERCGYLLEDHKTWVNYGDLDDKFPYDEDKKKWELSRNRMIEKIMNKMIELDLVDNINTIYTISPIFADEESRKRVTDLLNNRKGE
jgi:hypothetical protein